jgi:hypothetical protein
MRGYVERDAEQGSLALHDSTRSVPCSLPRQGRQREQPLRQGHLTTAKPKKALTDAFTNDPMHPVSSLGGQVCWFFVAHNVIPHAPMYLSEIVLPVVRPGSVGGSK